MFGRVFSKNGSMPPVRACAATRRSPGGGSSGQSTGRPRGFSPPVLRFRSSSVRSLLRAGAQLRGWPRKGLVAAWWHRHLPEDERSSGRSVPRGKRKRTPPPDPSQPPKLGRSGGRVAPGGCRCCSAMTPIIRKQRATYLLLPPHRDPLTRPALPSKIPRYELQWIKSRFLCRRALLSIASMGHIAISPAK